MRKLLLPILLLGGGCFAASNQAAPSGTDDALVSGGICATLDYGPRGSASELYRFFASKDEAARFITAVLAGGQAASFVGPGASLVGIDADERAARLVREVFTGFQRAFPRETAGLTSPPPVAIVKSTALNAFALGHGFAEAPGAPVDKSPWIFVVNTALLEHGNTDDEVQAVIAHELGHLVLQTFLASITSRVRHAWVVEGSEDGFFGEAQVADASVSAQVATILRMQDRVGVAPQVGYAALLPSLYGGVLQGQIASRTERTAESDAACATFQTKLGELREKQKAFFPRKLEGSLEPRLPSAEERTELDDGSAQILAAANACFSVPSEVTSLRDLAMQRAELGPDTAPDAIDAAMLPIEKQVDAEMPSAPLANRILRAEPLLRAALFALRTDPSIPFDRLRVYDAEEDADDASMRVMAAIGKDPRAIGSYIVSTLPDDLRHRCLDAVAAHAPIDFGAFYDLHPLSCWRYYHAQQFGSAVLACSSGPEMAPQKGPLDTKMPALATWPLAQFSAQW